MAGYLDRAYVGINPENILALVNIIERRINKATFKVKKGEDPIDGCSRAEAAESPSPRGSLWTARP